MQKVMPIVALALIFLGLFLLFKPMLIMPHTNSEEVQIPIIYII